ncbi:rRNA pseudouridine synthase [Membranicola marinus]|uniref:Pseudouridine synthase n=1 Tax=Membranihabitans marinus TaxID=1227546 RepID=A0A953HLF7_9BACT|nr:pseudouridine synthase [Membranihabitans marinus]MBY5957832.1 rRNA pseudouridine synthase [Membranihabitans marinus]
MKQDIDNLWPMRLNKYIAYAGISSRRNAEKLVKQGKVTVNGEVVSIPFIEINEEDEVRYKGKVIEPTQEFIYLLLNKPKNCISTVSDDKDRRTVLDLVKESKQHRLYPVGRLDRNTTGLIILTNDGHLAQKLSHPSYEITKVYQATLDQPISENDLKKFQQGADLEDGYLKPDAVNFATGGGNQDVLIEIHSGKNRVVRRYFEYFGFKVIKLDRVYYAGLTKKFIGRGRYRPLTREEIRNLKHFT